MPIYMLIPGIKGDVTSGNYQGWIQVSQFEHGISITTTPMHAGRTNQRTVGGSQFSELSISKAIDSSSADLFRYCANAKCIDTVMVNITSDQNANAGNLLEYTFNDVLISHIHKTVSEHGPVETLGLSYVAIMETSNSKLANSQDESPSTIHVDMNDTQDSY